MDTRQEYEKLVKETLAQLCLAGLSAKHKPLVSILSTVGLAIASGKTDELCAVTDTFTEANFREELDAFAERIGLK